MIMPKKYKKIGKNYSDICRDELERIKDQYKKQCRSCGKLLKDSYFNKHVLRCSADKFDQNLTKV